MARHKKIETEEQGDPDMEISSMIDCCFLLLIYFLVATSLVSEKKFDMALPASSNSSSSSDSKPFNIKVTGDNAVYYEDQSGKKFNMGPATDFKLKPGQQGYYEERDLTELVTRLKSLNNDPRNPKPLILTADPSSKHQRVMDVMSALTQADIKAVAVKCEANN
ncbi:MAG: biopolymer transporter ExbD [Akkermansia sp.]|nr:biopolymer transporter ExbD [Akkermansia sp.]MBR3944551.1 biopolymer transporter ExbD [Akkermansia sp.]